LGVTAWVTPQALQGFFPRDERLAVMFISGEKTVHGSPPIHHYTGSCKTSLSSELLMKYHMTNSLGILARQIEIVNKDDFNK